MDLFELVKSKRSDILNLAHKYGANNVRIFGSVAKGTSNDQSDIDFLVDFNANASLLDWSGVAFGLIFQIF
jgi:predicted nucleotidyltransferase